MSGWFGLDDINSDEEGNTSDEGDYSLSSPLANRRAHPTRQAFEPSVSFALTTQWPATPSATAARNQLYEDSDSSDSEAEDEERKRREFSVDDAYDSEEEQWPVDPPLAKAPDRARLSALDVAASEAWRQGEVDDRARTWSAVNMQFSKQLQSLRLRQAEATEALRRKRAAERDAEAAEIASMIRSLSIAQDSAAAKEAEAFEARNKELWNAINATIAATERLAAQRAAEEAATRKAKEAAEKAAAEEAAERKRDEEERQARANAEKEKARKEAAALEEERQRAEEASRAVAEKAGEMGREWQRWTDKMRTIKTDVLPAVSNDTPLRKACSAAKRQITPRVGQLVNTAESVQTVTDQLNSILSGLHSTSLLAYTWGLNHLSKALIRQAETEVTAKQSVAFPLARVVVALILRGHAELGDVLMARLVKKCFWIAAWYPRRPPDMTAEAHEKLLGHQPASTGESGVQYSERMAGILALYAAILQTSPVDSPQGVFGVPPAEALSRIPEHFQASAGWRWLVRTLEAPLVSLEPVPNLLETFLGVAGAGLSEVFGRQFIKLLVCLYRQGLVERKAGFADKSRASQVKLQLLLEEWIAAGRVTDAEGRALQLSD